MMRKLAPGPAVPRARIGACAGLVVSLAGCPNPNLYTTPRSLARGQFQAQVALEANLTQCGSTWGVYDLSVPLLLGFNFSEKVSVVLSPGLSYTAVAGPGGFGGDTADEVLKGAGVISGTMASFGVGLDIRVLRQLAIHPEVTFERSFGDDHLLLWVAGIGFNLGAQPDYSDLR
jgi:hypothetical protein